MWGSGTPPESLRTFGAPECPWRGRNRRFAEAGGGGGFILSPSDHFFEADLELLAAFADEARRCVYGQWMRPVPDAFSQECARRQMMLAPLMFS